MPPLEVEMAEVLESECSVEMDKLLSLCRHGIPDRLRAEAWKYLLGVMRPEKSQELSLGKQMEQRYQQLEQAGQADPQSELSREIKAEVWSYRSAEPFFREPRTHQRLERLLRTYLHRHSTEYVPGMVHLLGPFVQVYRESDTDAYYGFDELMTRLEWGFTFEGRKQMIVFFMTLLRHTLPELYFHLEAEQRISDPSGSAWLESWLSLFLSKELPLPCVLQLWDAYFSSAPDGSLQELHTFVCLSVLETCQDELMELDDDELSQYLQHLPPMDMGQVVTAAFNMKDDCLARNVI